LKQYVIPTIVILSLAFFSATSYAAAAEPLFRTAIREYIEANIPWPPGSVRVDFLSKEPGSIPQNRDLILRVEPAGNQDFIGDMVFLVKSFKDGNLQRTESVRTRIEVQRDVVTAARGLPAGTVLTESDIRIVRRWVRRIHQHSLPSLEETSGKRLTIQVASGAEILASMLKEVPLVRKGKMVKMVFDNGAMQIVTVGLSEEDGVAGNIVRVKNITSNKIIYARVLNDSLVGIGF
jgi:flagella basal body P-ring formation protein FlgA